MHFITFFTSYSFFHMLLFMLIYKYRYRLYNYTCKYIHQSRINKSSFWSFILTSLIGSSCVLVTALLADGLCITLFQMILLCTAMLFGLAHSCIACFRMKKTTNSSYDIITFKNKRCLALQRSIQIIILSYLYFLPHVALFLIINISVSFISKPFSYLILFSYFGVSFVFVWISNTIAIYLLLPKSCGSIKKRNCRRKIFAVCMIIACNFLNFTFWGFIEILYYDNRGKAASFIAILPGLTVTLLGWYLKGDLVTFFDKLLCRPDTSRLENSSKEDISERNDHVSEFSSASLEAEDTFLPMTTPQGTISKLRRVMKTVQKSVITESPERSCSYVRMNQEGKMNIV